MNLIKTKIRDDNSTKEFRKLKEFRKIDMNNAYSIVKEYFENFSKLSSDFKYNIEISNISSKYLGDKESFFENLKIEMSDGAHTISPMNILIPRLIDDNYYILDGVLYIPLIFMEKGLIDLNVNKDNKTKVSLTLIPSFSITLSFNEHKVLVNYKKIDLTDFLITIFKDEPDYLESLVQSKVIKSTTTKTSLEDILKAFRIQKDDFFKNNDLKLHEFIDMFILIDYYKKMFKDYYGVDNIKDIIKYSIKMYLDGFEMDMANLNNRRLVMSEYLLYGIHEFYIRMVNELIQKNAQQNPLKTMNDNIVITTGFNKLMHRGQAFNVSNPYTLPFINKISQDIKIISDKRLPKSWTANHKTAFERLCPISVSAQDMATNLVATSTMVVNKFGRIYTEQNDL